MTLEAANIQWPQGATYQTGDRGTEALGVKDTVLPVPDNVVSAENFEINPITGSGTWIVDTTLPHTGLRYLRSAVITDNQSTNYTFPVPALATSVRFWHRVSSEAGFDFFKIYKNSISVPNQLFQLSGLLNTWQLFTVSLSGITSIIIEYSKDSSASAGLDAAFIDDIEWFIPGTPAIQNFEPYHLDTNNRVKVTLLGETVTVTGSLSIGNEIEIKNDIGNPVPVIFAVPQHTIVDSGTVVVTQGTTPWVSDDLTFANDKVDVSGSAVSVTGSVAVTGPLTDAQLRATAVPISGALTDTELRATPVPISGTVTVTDGSGPLTVDGTVSITGTVGVTQSTSPWVVTGPLTDTQLRATAVPVSGPLTDVQLRATPVPVSGTVTITDGSGPITVDGTVTVNQGTSPWVSDMTDRAARQVGLVDIRKASTVSTPAQTAITSVASTVLASNVNRRSYMIQNTGIVPVKLSLDGTSPTQTAYHLCLSPGTVADDGTGAVYMDDQWTGDVKAISPSAGTIVVTEVT